MPPIFTASSTCTHLNPVDIDPSILSSDFEYRDQRCTYELFLKSSTTTIPVSFQTPTTTSTTTVSTSSQFYVNPVFTGGDIIIIFFALIFLFFMITQAVIKSIDRIKTKKTYMGYTGGDVEIREDH